MYQGPNDPTDPNDPKSKLMALLGGGGGTAGNPSAPTDASVVAGKPGLDPNAFASRGFGAASQADIDRVESDPNMHRDYGTLVSGPAFDAANKAGGGAFASGGLSGIGAQNLGATTEPTRVTVPDAGPASAPGLQPGSVGQYGIPDGAVPDKFQNFTGGYNGKYGLLRTVSKYAPTADGLKAAIAEVNANHGTSTGGPGQYVLTGDDKVQDTSNGDLIDLIKNSGGPDAKWWYGSENEYNAAHPGGTPAGGGGGGGLSALLGSLGGAAGAAGAQASSPSDSILARIMAALTQQGA